MMRAARWAKMRRRKRKILTKDLVFYCKKYSEIIHAVLNPQAHRYRNDVNYTRSSADADNRRDAFSGQSRSTDIYTIPYIRYSFLLCNSNFVFQTFLYFLRYSTWKNVVTLKSGSEVTQCHWKWQHSIESIECCHFQWHWVTSDPDFKVTTFFEVEYREKAKLLLHNGMVLCLLTSTDR